MIGVADAAQRGAGVLLLALIAGCASVNEAPVIERSTAVVERGRAPRVPEHVVVAGDTLYGIAFRHGLDFRQLAVWNDIPASFLIRPGQRLRLSAPAPVARSAVALSGAPNESNRLEPPPVQDGVETFAASGEDSSVRSAPLDLSAHTPSASHSAIAVQPGPVQGAAVAPVPSRAGVESPSSRPATPIPAPRTTTPEGGSTGFARAPDVASTRTTTPAVVPPAPATQSAAATTAADPAPHSAIPAAPERTVAGLRWRWPATGRVTARFAGDDPSRQGIDIAGRSGESVRAAADGEVVYSGNGLIGYGELVIIKHSGEFLSAYGHNRRRLVREGERVRGGQQIGEMGRTGAAVDQLHFEIRRAGRPVDPLEFLPVR
jgi:lipoprotein NlpD